MSNQVPNLTFSNGVKIPQLGLGVFLVQDKPDLMNSIKWALAAGYRHIDTAKAYGNEEWVGEAIKASGIPREDLFITSKLWNQDHGYEEAKAAFAGSLERLGLDYLDLYLIHWPSDHYLESWKAMEELYDAGKIKAIGVSNFQIHHLEDVIAHAKYTPMINQIETHPAFPQNELHEFMVQHQILHESWGPLGQGKNGLLEQPVLVKLAQKYGKTTAQIVLRWHIDRGLVVIPKSIHEARIKENIDLFDFKLTPEDMAEIATLDTGTRYSINPDDTEFLRKTSAN